MPMRALGVAGLLLACLAAEPLPAAARVNPAEALERSEAAIGNATGDHRLLLSDGRTLTLSELKGGRWC